uniref:P1 family peptidase n=1 Tax=Streptomyces sp. WAC05458 TaxID=2487412 RepID=UPI0028A695B1|nr:P1 family peptidase [Streptomyces sp. WAC05458]
MADAELGPLFEAVLDGVEEAVLNSLLAATTTTGFGGRTVPVADAELGPLFEAVLDGVEEAVLNSLLAATTTTGFGGRTVPALPADALLTALGAPPRTPPR